MSAPQAIEHALVQAMLQRGRMGMVTAVIYESGLFHPQMVYDFWHGFADCAAALLNGGAAVMASHDQASHPQSEAQCALSSLPDDCERLSFSEMKRLLAAHLVDCASDAVTHSDVNTVVQVQDGVGEVVKLDDEPAIASVDVGDGGHVHAVSPVDAAIVAQGGAA